MGSITVTALESVTGIVEIVLPGPQGPVGDVNPQMFTLRDAAQTAATSAQSSATSASGSAATATTQATRSADWAEKTVGTVDGVGYSSKYHAQLASTSAQTATTKASEASASATSASGSASTASTKASEASTSATNAAASATAAATSATDTANALVGERSAVATLTNKTITSPVIDSGTANGVAYLNGSKVLTAGSGLTYNGSALQINAESYPSLKLGNAAGVSKGELYFGVGGDDLNLVSYVAGPIVFKPNNAEQMRLTSTGLGIGTSSPSQKLDVVGTSWFSADGHSRIAITPTLGDGGASVIRQYTTAPRNGGDLKIQVDSAIQGGNLLFATGGSTERMRLDASGNLGIGTSSPACKLDVSGTGVLAQFSNGVDANLNIKTATSLMTVGTGVAGSSLALMTADVERMRLDPAGNLGLGVVPSAWVSSSTALQNRNASFWATGAGAYVGYNYYYDGARKYIASGFATEYSQLSGQHLWYTAPSGTAGQPISLTQVMTLSASGGLMVGTSTDYGERLHVSSAGAGDVISMRIAASQENGSNGMARRIQWSLRGSTGSLINTNSIRSEWSDVGANSAKLVFTSAANNAQADAMTLDASGELRLRTDGGTARYFAGPTGAEAYFGYNSDGTAQINGRSGYAMLFSIGGSERARIDASGNLGLGVTPSAWSSLSALHVKGTAHFAGFSSGAEGALVTSNAYFNGTNWIYQMGAAASNFRQSGGAHQWYTAPSGAAGDPISFTQAMTLSASGHLLIGATSSDGVGSARAQIGNASAATTGLLLKSNTSSASLYASSTSSSYLTWKTGTFMALGTAPDNLGTFAEYARIDSSGNLLVGKTAQSSGGKLEVAGNVVCRPSTAAPTLAVNGEMSFQLVSDTSLKILVRGSDGITRSTTLTLT